MFHSPGLLIQPIHAFHNLNNLGMFSQHCSDGQHMLLDALSWRLKMSVFGKYWLLVFVCSPSEYSRYHIHVMCVYSNSTPFSDPYPLPCSQSLTHCPGQVKAKYDTIARLWAALPTDAQVQRRQALLQADLVS